MKFEKALTTLEGVVQQLESGDLTLDESLKAFEKGIKLTRECQQQLSVAEQTVQALLSNTQSGNTAESAKEESNVVGQDLWEDFSGDDQSS